MANNSMQFFLARPLSEVELIPALTNMLGLPVLSVDHPIEGQGAFLQMVNYPEGQFPIGVGLSWPPGLQPRRDDLEIARELATHFNVRVALEPPTNRPGVRSPSSWYVVDPSGQVSEILEDSRLSESADGLFLDEDSKRVLAL